MASTTMFTRTEDLGRPDRVRLHIRFNHHCHHNGEVHYFYRSFHCDMVRNSLRDELCEPTQLSTILSIHDQPIHTQGQLIHKRKITCEAIRGGTYSICLRWTDSPNSCSFDLHWQRPQYYKGYIEKDIRDILHPSAWPATSTLPFISIYKNYRKNKIQRSDTRYGAGDSVVLNFRDNEIESYTFSLGGVCSSGDKYPLRPLGLFGWPF